MIIETFCTGPIATNAVLIACERTKEAAIIDAPPGFFEPLKEKVKSLEVEPKMLLITHSHWDHIATAAQIKEAFGTPIYIHPLDAENLKNPGSDQLPMVGISPFAESTRTIEGADTEEREIKIPPTQPDHFLANLMQLKVGDLTIQVIHTPGHSPGGVCFYIEKEKLLISGDTLFRHTIGNLSLPTAEEEKMWPSLQKLAALPSDTRVITGHGEDTIIGEEPWLGDAKSHFGGG